ncbi:lipid transferase CIDEB isoform X2 [Carettochelys insculpta]|uniref:lipid transferase CIDEB isoform X2 n=1 Tax=Carettochelys insculpta TaxID=44489 RepID=UPI003EC0610D
MDYLSALVPSSLLQSVSSAGRRARAPPQRPFRVCDHRRGARTGLVAATLQELLVKAPEALLVAGPARLVLEEDGTAVQSEAFFEALPPDTALMLLGPGQGWSPPRGPGLRAGPGAGAPGAGHRPHHLRPLQAAPPRPLRQPQRERHLLRALLRGPRLPVPRPQEAAQGGAASRRGRDAGHGAAAARRLQLHPAPPGGGGDLAPALSALPL